jgi:hypothetical protein
MVALGHDLAAAGNVELGEVLQHGHGFPYSRLRRR